MLSWALTFRPASALGMSGLHSRLLHMSIGQAQICSRYCPILHLAVQPPRAFLTCCCKG